MIQIQEPEQAGSSAPILALGIDLGTTHSLVAVSDEGCVRILDLGGALLLPSRVAVTEERLVVGQEVAVLEAAGVPVLGSFKRLMGGNGETPLGAWFAVRDASPFPHPVRFDPEQGPLVEIAGREISPVVLSACVLTHLKEKACEALGYEVTQAVITVPAYFDEAARHATRKAGMEAGFDVLRVLSEPTAAALAYGLDQGIQGLWGVFDLGGGTFDFSLLKMTQGVFQVMGTGGDVALGGDDFDEVLARHQAGEGWRTLTSQERGEALKKARRLREALSTEPIQDGVTCETFEGLIQPAVQSMLHCVARVLKEARVDVSQMCGVILVGGATRTPLIRQAVASFFGKEPLASLDPDQVVALGAALQAEALTYGAQHLLLDVTPLSLGLEVDGEQVEVLIPRNTRIPVSQTQMFTTQVDGQNALRLHVLQGEKSRVSGCRSLAQFELRGIPPLPAGQARIQVTFAIDTDGLLTVTAREETTGMSQVVQVKPSYGLTPEIMKEVIRETL